MSASVFLFRLDQQMGDDGTDVVLPRGNRSQTQQEFRGNAVLDHVAAHAEVKSGIEALGIPVHRQKHEFRREGLLMDPPGDLDPVQHRHGHVEHRNIRTDLRDQPERLRPITGLTDHRKRPVPLDRPYKSLPEYRVVVDNQDPR